MSQDGVLRRRDFRAAVQHHGIEHAASALGGAARQRAPVSVDRVDRAVGVPP
jgi:hypothetical protein